MRGHEMNERMNENMTRSRGTESGEGWWDEKWGNGRTPRKITKIQTLPTTIVFLATQRLELGTSVRTDARCNRSYVRTATFLFHFFSLKYIHKYVGTMKICSGTHFYFFSWRWTLV